MTAPTVTHQTSRSPPCFREGELPETEAKRTLPTTCLLYYAVAHRRRFEGSLAIVGNQNGNGFSLLRFFREAGVDAHLFLYHNDGADTFSHFAPSNMTADIERWNKHISRLPASDYFLTLLPSPVSWLYFFMLKLLANFGLVSEPPAPIRAKPVRKALDGFDRYLGFGVAPGMFLRLRMHLDIFIPYSTGVEYVEGTPLLRFREMAVGRLIAKFFFFPARAVQVWGLRRVRSIVLSADRFATEVLDELHLNYTVAPLPFTYIEPLKNPNLNGDLLPEAFLRFRSSRDIIFLSSVRHYWDLKRNDFFLRGFAEAIRDMPVRSVGLVLMEYGHDVNRSKALLEELDIADRVLWIQKSSWLEAIEISRHSDVVVGQFDLGGTIWGNAGWEALALGKPLLQGFYWNEGEFQAFFGLPEPPILPVKSSEDIVRHTLELTLDSALRKKRGFDTLAWYRRHHGESAADGLIRLLSDRSRESTA